MVSNSEAPRTRYHNERETISNRCTDAEQEAIFEFLDAYDPDLERPTPPEGDNTKAETTLYNYARDLRYCSGWVESPLTDATIDEINDTMKALYEAKATNSNSSESIKSSTGNQASRTNPIDTLTEMMANTRIRFVGRS